MRYLIGGALALALALAPAYAQDDDSELSPDEVAELAAKPIPPAPMHGGAALTASDVEAFSDGLVPTAMAFGDIAGAVVVVVKDGQVLFQKGYGVADTKTRAPVDPDKTLFRPGSVSKLFVWTAVMQLVGAGKLDLDKDVNAYLDFTIPPAFGKPITLRNLMTHTPGFEESYRALLVGNPKAVPPLADVVKGSIPARIFPPGEVPAYSNYGATLAGYIVQRVSGEKFEDYVRHHIFMPLGMTHSTFEQPLPPALARDMSKGYGRASGPAVPFEMIGLGPAGGLSASGADMAHFMIAHLHAGAYGGQRILLPELAVRMHGVANRPFSALSPMAYGFYHDDMNGYRIVAHGGDTGVFHSELELVLDADVGIFLSMNSAGINGMTSKLRRAYVRAFMDRYFPAPKSAPLPTLKTAKADGETIAGTYVVSRRGDSNFTHMLSLFDTAKIGVDADGTVEVSILRDAAGNVKHWREVKPFVWQEVNGTSFIQAAFKDGHVDQIGADDLAPVHALQPAGLTQAPWNFWLLVGSVAMLALAVVFWPIKAILRWRYDRPLGLRGRNLMLYRLTRIVALIDVVFLAGYPVTIAVLGEHLASNPPWIDGIFRGLQVLGIVGIVGTAAVAAEFVAALRDPARPWWTKATDGLLVLASLVVVWFAFSQNLLTLGLHY